MAQQAQTGGPMPPRPTLDAFWDFAGRMTGSGDAAETQKSVGPAQRGALVNRTAVPPHRAAEEAPRPWTASLLLPDDLPPPRPPPAPLPSPSLSTEAEKFEKDVSSLRPASGVHTESAEFRDARLPGVGSNLKAEPDGAGSQALGSEAADTAQESSREGDRSQLPDLGLGDRIRPKGAGGADDALPSLHEVNQYLLGEEGGSTANGGEGIAGPLQSSSSSFMWEAVREKRETEVSEVEIMKERFAKLLLGEDMSGGSKGVCPALAISNAITNLSASIFGERNKLSPLPPERKKVWRREMEWLLCVSDHIVELVPAWHTAPDGTEREVMVSKQRGDLHANLPALRKLDNILLDSLDTFSRNEFGYEKPGSGMWGDEPSGGRHADKWWLPTPRVPPGGLSEAARRHLQHHRDVGAQVLKAAMAINSQTLAEMEVPDEYCDTLPKSVRAALGEPLYRALTLEHTPPHALLAMVDLRNEHSALEMANKLESCLYIWRRMLLSRTTPLRDPNSRHVSEVVRELRGDTPLLRAEEYADGAESALLLLRQKCPGLPQTALDGYKIQYNRDVGKSILESYSRVLESLASNVVARIEDVLYVDKAARGPPETTAVSEPFTKGNADTSLLSTLSGNTPLSPVAPPVLLPPPLTSASFSEVELAHSSPTLSPSGDPAPSSPLSIKSDSSFRDRIMWRRRPPTASAPMHPSSSSASLTSGAAGSSASGRRSFTDMFLPSGGPKRLPSLSSSLSSRLPSFRSAGSGGLTSNDGSGHLSSREGSTMREDKPSAALP
eukprot:TRINITY_DN5238_c0_g1_i1.p1 TRINITY_DN5238_c0_g1~~TRINITY_DN5238_c0_g1_i1.p1  ORF type:complete len:782 (+),score=156.08 TRINITY_DN5238_c0_g1_i1:646-2991(+)